MLSGVDHAMELVRRRVAIALEIAKAGYDVKTMFLGRLVTERMVPARELRKDPRTLWIYKPEERRILQRLLDGEGITSPPVVRETPAGLELVDGHIPRGLPDEELISALVVDLDEEEVKTLLFLMGPMALMAWVDIDRLAGFLGSIHNTAMWRHHPA